MKLTIIRRRSLAGMLIVTLLLSLAGYAATPTSDETWRIIRIHGRLVRLRSGIPPQLTHKNTVRHLTPGEILVADRIGYGVSSNGKGTGVWMHVIDLNNGECGWVSGAFVNVIAGEPIEQPMATLEQTGEGSQYSKMTPVSPSLSSIHDIAPPDAREAEEPTFLTDQRKKYGADVQFAGSIATVIAVMLSAAMLLLSLPALPGSRPTPAAPIPVAPVSIKHDATNHGDMRRTPNFVYGLASGLPYRFPTSKR